MSNILFPDSSNYIPPAPPSVKSAGRDKKVNRKIFYIGGALTILITSIAVGALWGNKINTSLPDDSKIIKQVSSLIELPNEKPIIASVTEKEIANKSSFFKSAQIGDTILVFKSAKKAYLYRSSENKIIEVGTISENSGQVAGQNTSVTPIPTATISVLPTSEATDSAQLN